MKIVWPGLVAVLLAVASYAWGADGLVMVKSPHSPKDTMDRLEAMTKQRGLTIFARIDHAAGAASVGETLRPTIVLILGNPQGGTPFMQCAQTVGIDLPAESTRLAGWIGTGAAGLQRSVLPRAASRRAVMPGDGEPEEGAFRSCPSGCWAVDHGAGNR